MKILILLVTLVSLNAFANEGKAEADNSALFPPKMANKSLVTVAPAPVLEAPAFMTHVNTDSVTLQWKAAEGAASYHVQVATDPNFKWLKVDETLYPQTSIQVSGLEKGKHYYWRVAGLKPDNDPSYLKGPYAKSMFATVEK